MNLISESIINNISIKYYDGIDLNVVKNHPKDGSKGMLFFFIENWESEIRNHKIDTIITNINYTELSDIDNSYIVIYQYSNIPIMKLYEIIKDKIETSSFNLPWALFPVLK